MTSPVAEPVRPSGGCVVRAPVLPLAVVTSLSDGLTGDADHDLVLVDERLRAVVKDPVVREAIFLASPSLDERLDPWLSGAADTRMTRSVLSYVSRMATRCTPFGLFAGCAAGTVGDGPSRFQLGPRDALERHTRLDFEYLARVVTDLEHNEATRAALRFVPNSSLYRAGGRLRLAEASYDGSVLRYRRVAVEDDEYLTDTLDRARDGGAYLADLAAGLVTDEISLDEAVDYVNELVDGQLLVSDLGPAVTGDEPNRALAERLIEHPETKGTGTVLARAQDDIERLDREGVGQAPASFRAIATALREAGTDVEIARLFQADLVLGRSDIHVGEELLALVHRAVAVLHRLHPPASDDTELARFKRSFAARYEGAEVPLVEALDEEIGVGLGSTGSSADGQPLLPGPVAAGGGGESGPRLRPAELVLLELVDRCRAEGRTTLALDEAHIDRMAPAATRPVPDAFAVHATVLAGGAGVLIHHASGPSGVRMLGRFCHADAGIDDVVRANIAAEEALAPEARFFEIVHLPEGRIGNVLCRPVLRDLEVEYLGRSGAPVARVLPATDLLVSLDNDRLRLRSASLGCEVVGRLSTAHNLVSSRIALYRFLGALQGDGRSEAMVWRWGPLEALAFLPRVTVGEHIVLSRARWRLKGDDLAALRNATDPGARLVAMRALAARHRLPRWVALAQSDHELVVDAEAVTGAELVAFEARRAPELTLVEVLDLEGAATSPAGRHAAEVIVPMVRAADPKPTPMPAVPPVSIRRSFPPGSEWLSFKLYCGAATADAVLREVVAPVISSMHGGVIDRWFFLRYADPDWHLRVRLHGAPEQLSVGAIGAVHAAAASFLADGRIGAVVIDTYRREVERYGGPSGIELFEAISGVDSDAVLAIVRLTPGDEGLDRRWRLAAVGIDRLLADLGFDIATRQQLVRGWRDGLVAELGERWTQHAGTVHRRHGRELAALLDGATDDPGVGVLAARSAANAPVVGALLRLAATGQLTRSVESIASSYAHMHVNRMLRGAARVQELVLYDLLDRWYRALLARPR